MSAPKVSYAGDVRISRRGAKSGIRMLSYPFPYARPDVRARFAGLSRVSRPLSAPRPRRTTGQAWPTTS